MTREVRPRQPHAAGENNDAEDGEGSLREPRTPERRGMSALLHDRSFATQR